MSTTCTSWSYNAKSTSSGSLGSHCLCGMRIPRPRGTTAWTNTARPTRPKCTRSMRYVRITFRCLIVSFHFIYVYERFPFISIIVSLPTFTGIHRPPHPETPGQSVDQRPAKAHPCRVDDVDRAHSGRGVAAAQQPGLRSEGGKGSATKGLRFQENSFHKSSGRRQNPSQEHQRFCNNRFTLEEENSFISVSKNMGLSEEILRQENSAVPSRIIIYV